MNTATLPISFPGIPSLQEVTVRLIRPGEKCLWETGMRQHHYLGFTGMVGESLRYVATYKDQWCALLGWQAAALKCKPRDCWIGWPPVLHYQRLFLIANNCRFLILPEIQCPNLASRVLSLNLKRLSADWEAVHGHPLLLAETFVDPARFAGTCYKAANWQKLGITQGYAKHGVRYSYHHQPKSVWVYPLHPQAQQRLSDPHFQTRRIKPMHPKTFTASQLKSLHQLIAQLPDCRRPRGIRHRYRTVLTIAIAAVLCGARSFAALGEIAASLTQSQLRQIGARFNAKTKTFHPPEESTLRRVLQASDPETLDRLLGQWLLAQAPTDNPLSIDGKTLRGARRPDGSTVHLLSAFLHQQGITVAQTEVGQKTNEIPCVKPLLDPLDIQGRVVTADALHTQTETARHIVENKKAHYVFTVKKNQKGLYDDLAALGSEAFSPCV